MHIVGPKSRLHLTDVSLLQYQHTKPRLPYSAADRERKIALNHVFVESILKPLFTTCDFELLHHTLCVYAYAHRGYFHAVVKHVVVKDYVAVQVPVIVVGCASVVRLAV